MISKVIIILWSLFCGWGIVSGVMAVSDMAQDSDAAAAGAGIGIMMWIFLWGLVVVPTALIGLLFKRNKATSQG